MCKFVKSRFCPNQGDLEAVITVKFIIRASDKERLRPFRAAAETSYGYLFSRNRILADFSFQAGEQMRLLLRRQMCATLVRIWYN